MSATGDFEQLIREQGNNTKHQMYHSNSRS
jgi:hypothetical protein